MTTYAREHDYHKCKCGRTGCMFCDGGLAACTTCGGFEGSLLRFCPGFKLSREALDAVYSGNVYDLETARKYKEAGFLLTTAFSTKRGKR